MRRNINTQKKQLDIDLFFFPSYQQAAVKKNDFQVSGNEGRIQMRFEVKKILLTKTEQLKLAWRGVAWSKNLKKTKEPSDTSMTR